MEMGGRKLKKLIAIGEVLIDFIPEQKNCGLGEVKSFSPAVGGAPANVCGAFTKLGGESAMITQLGKDAFGEKIIKELKNFGIHTEYIATTEKANTCLAFVSLMEDGNRDFSFYRNPSADMLLSSENIKKEWFENSFALHFCSVSLGDYPMMEAHKTAIQYALESGAIISFDPNIRLPLWKDHEALKKRIWEFIPYAHILKISDEELEFITGCKTMEAIDMLFKGNVTMVIFTKGSDGSEVYTKKGNAFAEGKQVNAVDTTGAGDAFIGSFLAQLAEENQTVDTLQNLKKEDLEKYLEFSNYYCSLSVMKKGAIISYPTKEQL